MNLIKFNLVCGKATKKRKGKKGNKYIQRDNFYVGECEMRLNSHN